MFAGRSDTGTRNPLKLELHIVLAGCDDPHALPVVELNVSPFAPLSWREAPVWLQGQSVGRPTQCAKANGVEPGLSPASVAPRTRRQQCARACTSISPGFLPRVQSVDLAQNHGLLGHPLVRQRGTIFTSGSQSV